MNCPRFAPMDISRKKLSITVPILLLLATLLISNVAAVPQDKANNTATPIQHLVVIFQENVSLDHFATYPVAANPAGEPQFTADPNTPSVNGLSGNLLTNNPNLVNPFRLDRSQALTCDMNHDYTPEQQAFDGGLMDEFVQYTSSSGLGCDPSGATVMGYYDGNTVTAIWEYAQNFAMN